MTDTFTGNTISGNVFDGVFIAGDSDDNTFVLKLHRHRLHRLRVCAQRLRRARHR